MNITGLITEYNPFHLGHLYHLQKAKIDTNCDGVICIMSGNFMQRGIPAIIDKWERANIAVANGVDLVIELPLVYSISSAEGFAHGACSILNSTGVVNSIYFGSESGNIEELKRISQVLITEPEDFKLNLKLQLDKGVPFHTARKIALKNSLHDICCEEIIGSSNNILAIEYIKSLSKLNSSIVPYTLKRQGANYNDSELNNIFSSATSIRNALKNSGNLKEIETTVSKETFSYLKKLKEEKYNFVFNDDIFQYVKYKILTSGETLNKVYDVKEGLDNKIVKEITNSKSIDELILNIKSKRYTYTRINRILTSFFLGLEKYDIDKLVHETPNYIRPLAFNETGSKILKEIKKKGNIEILTKLPKKLNDEYLEIDLLGTKAYSILNSSVSPYDDYLKSPTFFRKK